MKNNLSLGTSKSEKMKMDTNKLTAIRILFIGIIAIGFLQSCKNKNPSTVKIFVRSAVNLLEADSKVVIIADKNANESNIEYVDTLFTNNEGFIAFDVKEYYSEAGKSVEVANFKIIAKKNGKVGVGTIRSRVNTVAVETVFLEQ